jgi:hypothetical protein
MICLMVVLKSKKSEIVNINAGNSVSYDRTLSLQLSTYNVQ